MMTTPIYITLLIVLSIIFVILLVGACFLYRENFHEFDESVFGFSFAALICGAFLCLMYFGIDESAIKLNDYRQLEEQYVLVNYKCQNKLGDYASDVYCQVKLHSIETDMNNLKIKLGVK